MKNIQPIINQKHQAKFDFYLLGLILIMAIVYLIGLLDPSTFNRLHTFNLKTVADTAQVARNTIRGDFFVTKYILPVGYMYNPIIAGHPDFIRYPLQVILYSLLFLLFSPDPVVINLFSGFLFVINAIVMYKLFLKIGDNEKSADGSGERKDLRLPAFLASLFTSLCVTQYFVGIYTGLQEIIAYCIVALFITAILSIPDRSFIIGILAGLIYLARPNMVLIVPIIFLGYFYFQYRKNIFWRTAFGCAAGIALVVLPFVIRSYYYTGELTFGLQHKVDIIKGLKQYPHDELYHTFSFPPSAKSVILNNLAAYFQRWLNIVTFTLKIIFNTDYWVAWIGLIPFILFFRRSAWVVYAYLGFLISHILIASNYLFIPTDAIRIYIPIMTLLTAFGYWGFFTMIANLSVKKEVVTYKRIFPVGILLITALVVIQYTHDFSRLPQKESLGELNSISMQQLLEETGQSQDDQSSPTVQTIKAMNLSCVYTNDPYWSSWNLDIPSLYRTDNFDEMLTGGPKECDHFLWYVPLKDDREKIANFLVENATLVYGDSTNVRLYKFNGK